jgi:ribosomal protein S18 acetylase RimI-like enzyme
MPVTIREFTPSDYNGAMSLWSRSSGVVLRDVDDREPLLAYLGINPGLSFVAVDGDSIIGAVLCGTDGRRGYLQHLAVAASHRRRGIGRRLANQCMDALARRGIDKCHLMLLADNAEAAAFWERLGWVARSDIRLMSHTTSGVATA